MHKPTTTVPSWQTRSNTMYPRPSWTAGIGRRGGVNSYTPGVWGSGAGVEGGGWCAESCRTGLCLAVRGQPRGEKPPRSARCILGRRLSQWRTATHAARCTVCYVLTSLLHLQFPLNMYKYRLPSKHVVLILSNVEDAGPILKQYD